jgi:hypothetical protein
MGNTDLHPLFQFVFVPGFSALRWNLRGQHFRADPFAFEEIPQSLRDIALLGIDRENLSYVEYGLFDTPTPVNRAGPVKWSCDLIPFETSSYMFCYLSFFRAAMTELNYECLINVPRHDPSGYNRVARS